MGLIAKKDFLISTPYQSFDYVIHFLREAAIDPKVKEISIYRLPPGRKLQDHPRANKRR
jgi:polyphosphate kinase